MKNIFWVLFISMLPIIELRGAIPVGAALGLEFYENYICAVIGNILPVPFILIFIPKILKFLGKFRLFHPIVDWLEKKAHKNRGKIIKSETSEDGVAVDIESTVSQKKSMSGATFIALMLFVLIPLPGTGAWTGSLVASLFDFPKKQSFIAVLLGVIGSGIIMCLASYGVVGFLSFLAK